MIYVVLRVLFVWFRPQVIAFQFIPATRSKHSELKHTMKNVKFLDVVLFSNNNNNKLCIQESSGYVSKTSRP